MILGLCEQAAGRHGFRDLELMATMSGEPLYTAYGFIPVEPVVGQLHRDRHPSHANVEGDRPGRLAAGPTYM